MKRRLIILATFLVFVVSLGTTLAQPLTARAASCDPNIENCPANGSGGSGGSGGSDGCQLLPASCSNPLKPGSTPVTKACPESLPGFPKASDNPAAFIGGTPFVSCEIRWAQATNNSVPGSSAPDYCQRTFTGDYLTSCNKGLNTGGQGDVNSVCGNDAVCKLGFAVGGDPTENPNAPGGGGSVSDSPPDCESESGNFNLAWIFCPVINGAASAVDGIYSGVIQPLLETKPINLSNPQKDPSNTFAIWSNFRLYGNIFLIIALLAVVFGESISGGLIDAYTAKKVLPRLLLAAILINISIYIVAVAVDITNIIGNGIASLIQTPFHEAACSAKDNLTSTTQNCFALKIGDATADIGGLGVIALVGAGTGSIWAAMHGSAIAIEILGPLIQFLLIFVLIPMFLTFIAIMVTVLLRQGLILFLVLIAPVAFALYCLPNTEQYFRRWWDLLFKTLLIYPLVAIMFALGNVLSVTISSSTGGLSTVFADLLAVVALFVPLFLIPFSFRIAGGVLGRFHEFATNARKQGYETVKGNTNDPNSLRNRTKRKVNAGITRGRAQAYRSWRDTGKAPRVGGLLFGGALEKDALLTQESKQRIGAVKDNGDDSVVNARASFTDTDGKRKTLDGKEVSAMDWRAAKRLYPTLGEMQAVAEYRAGKITNNEQADQFMHNYGLMAQQQGLSVDETNGAYIGFSFGKQNEFGHLKYGSYGQGNDGLYTYHPIGDTKSFEGGAKSKAAGFIDENYHNRNAFAAGAQRPEFHHALADTKAGYIQQLGEYISSGGQGPLTEEQSLAHDKLKQVIEMQDNFEYGGGVEDPNNPGQIVRSGKGQLQGASAGTQAAFNEVKEMDNNPAVAPYVQKIRDEIKNGRTYEAEHSPNPGDFGPGSRPYRP